MEKITHMYKDLFDFQKQEPLHVDTEVNESIRINNSHTASAIIKLQSVDQSQEEYQDKQANNQKSTGGEAI